MAQDSFQDYLALFAMDPPRQISQHIYRYNESVLGFILRYFGYIGILLELGLLVIFLLMSVSFWVYIILFLFLYISIASIACSAYFKHEQNKIIKHGVVYAAQIVELKALWINIHSEQLYMVTLLFTSSTGRIVRGRTTVWARIAKQLVELSEAKKTINILYYPNILHFVALPVNNMFPGIPFYKLKSE